MNAMTARLERDFSPLDARSLEQLLMVCLESLAAQVQLFAIRTSGSATAIKTPAG